MEVGNVLWLAELDTSKALEDFKSFEKSLNSVTFQVSSKTKSLNSLVIAPKVDHTQLIALNKHLDLKLSHYKQLQSYFDKNPLTVKVRQDRVATQTIKPKYNNSELMQFRKDIKGTTTEYSNLATLMQTNPLKAVGSGRVVVSHIVGSSDVIDLRLQDINTNTKGVVRALTPLTKLTASQITQPIITALGAVGKVVAVAMIAREVKSRGGIKGLLGGASEKVIKPIRNVSIGSTVGVGFASPKLPKDMKEKGVGIANDLKRGLELGLNGSVKGFKFIGQRGLKDIKQVLGIKSPSKAFEYVGKMIVQGVEKGIESTKNPLLPFRKDIATLLEEFKTLGKEVGEIKIPSPTVTMPKGRGGSSQPRTDLSTTLSEVQGIAMSGSSMFSSNNDAILGDKAKYIGSDDFKAELESMSNSMMASLGDIKDEAIITIDGYSSNTEKASKDFARTIRAVTGNKATILPVALTESDIANLDPIAAAQKIVSNFHRSNKGKGTSPEAKKLAAKIIAVSKKNSNANLQIVGRGYGGNIVQEALFILEKAGYKDLADKTKGTGIGTVKSLVPYQSKNFQSVVPSISPLKTLGVSDKGEFDPAKYIKDTVVRNAVTRPAVAATTAAIPALGAYRLATAPFALMRARYQLATRGVGTDEANAPILENMRTQDKPSRIRAIQNVRRELNAQRFGGKGYEPNAIERFAESDKKGSGIARGFLAFDAKVTAMTESLKISSKTLENAEKKIKARVLDVVAPMPKIPIVERAKGIKTAGVGSLVGTAELGVMKALSGGLAVGATMQFMKFAVTIPDMIVNLGLAFAKTLEPYKVFINQMAGTSNAFSNVAKTALDANVSLALVAEKYTDFMMLAESNVINKQQADDFATQITQLVGNRNIDPARQGDVYDQFRELLSNNGNTMTSNIYSLDKNIAGASSTILQQSGSATALELQEKIQSGQLDNVRLMKDVLGQLSIESASFSYGSSGSVFAADQGLQSAMENMQYQLGDVGLDEFQVAIVNAQTQFVNFSTTILKGVLKISEILSYTFGVAAAASILKFIAMMQRSADPVLLGVNLWQKYTASLTGFNANLANTNPMLASVKTGVTNFVKALAPIALIGAGIAMVADAIGQVGAKAEATRAKLAVLKEAYNTTLGKDKNGNVTRKGNIGQGNENIPILSSLLATANPFGKRHLGEQIARMTMGRQSFQSVTGEIKDQNIAVGGLKEGVFAGSTAKELATMRDYQKALVEVKDTFTLIQQESKVLAMTPAQLEDVKKKVVEIDSAVTVAKIQMSKFKVEGDFSKFSEAKQQLADLKKEKDGLISNSLGDIAPFTASIKTLKDLKSEYTPVFAGANMTEDSFLKMMENPQVNKASLELIEPMIAQKGFKSLEDFKKYLEETNKAILQGEEGIAKYNDTLASTTVLLNATVSKFMAIKNATTSQTFGNEIVKDKDMGELIKARLGKDISGNAFADSKAQIELDVQIRNKQALEKQLADMGKVFTEVDPSTLSGLQEALNIKGNVVDGSQSLSPDAIQSTIQSLQSGDENFNPLVAELGNQLATYRTLQGELLQSNNAIGEAQIAQQTTARDRAKEMVDFQRQVADFDLTIADYFRQRSRSIDDFEIKYRDIAVQNQRATRGLVEQFNDLGRSLDTQLFQVTNQLKAVTAQIKAKTLSNMAKSALNFGASGLFANFFEFLDGIISEDGNLQQQATTLEEQRLQTAEETYQIAIQIRGLQEQAYDLEQQRIAQLEQLRREQEDFALSQASAWLSIQRQSEDMVLQAQSMGLNFKGIAESLNGINTSYATIHNAISEFSKTMSSSLASGGVSGAVGDATGLVGKGYKGESGLQLNSIVAVGKYLEKQGFVIGEHSAWNNGIVESTGHSDGSKHYQDLALDINANQMAGGEKKNLDELYAWLKANKEAFGVSQLLWQTKGHYSHLHVAFKTQEWKEAFQQQAATATKASTEAIKAATGGGSSPVQSSDGFTSERSSKVLADQVKILQQQIDTSTRTYEGKKQSSVTNALGITELSTGQKQAIHKVYRDTIQQASTRIELAGNLKRAGAEEMSQEQLKLAVKSLLDLADRGGKASGSFANELQPWLNQVYKLLHDLKVIDPKLLSSAQPNLNFASKSREINVDVAFAGQSDIPLLQQLGLDKGLTVPTTLDVDKGELVAQALTVREVLRQAGFPESVIPTMIGIAGGESGFNANAHNRNASTGDDSYGLLQVNMIGELGAARRKQYGIKNEDLFDPLINAKVAKSIYDSQGLSAWGAYTNGSYQKSLGGDPAVRYGSGGPVVGSMSGGGVSMPSLAPINAPNMSGALASLGQSVANLNPADVGKLTQLVGMFRQGDVANQVSSLQGKVGTLSGIKGELTEAQRKELEQQIIAERLKNEKGLLEQAEAIRTTFIQQSDAIRNLNREFISLSRNAKGFMTYTENSQLATEELDESFRTFKANITDTGLALKKTLDMTDNKESINGIIEDYVKTIKEKANVSPEFLTKLESEVIPKLKESATKLDDLTPVLKEIEDGFDAIAEKTRLSNIELTKFNQLIKLNTDFINPAKGFADLILSDDKVLSVSFQKLTRQAELANSFAENKRNIKLQIENLQLELANPESIIDKDTATQQLSALQYALDSLTPELEFNVRTKAMLDIDFENQQSGMNSLIAIQSRLGEKNSQQSPLFNNEYSRLAKINENATQLATQLKEINDLRANFKGDEGMLAYLTQLENETRRLSEIDFEGIEAQVNGFATAIREPMQSAFTALFSDVIKGTKSIQDVFVQFLESIANNFAQMASTFATNGLMNFLFPTQQPQQQSTGFNVGGLFSGLLGGLFGGGGGLPSFTGGLSVASGLTIPHFADGGEVMGLGMGMAKALRREGTGAVPIVAHVGEELLSAKNGDAQRYRQWKAPEFGGFSGSRYIENQAKSRSRDNQSGGYNTVINVTTPNANSFRSSLSQISQEEKLRQLRMDKRR